MSPSTEYASRRRRNSSCALADFLFPQTVQQRMSFGIRSNSFERERRDILTDGFQGESLSEPNLKRGLPSTPSFEVLGVRVDATQIPEAITGIEDWICARRGCRYVAVTGMHGVTEAQHDPQFRSVLNDADLVVPDGMSLVWCARLRGHALRRRVYGPELMLTFCRQTTAKGYRHFLYGGDVGVADRLAAVLQQSCPGIQIAGTFSPPFGPLAPEEDSSIVEMIHQAQPDVLWVGLGTPKQEKWMREHRDRLDVPVLVGVGAAFDILSTRKKQAPAWMREHGLEWLFRLIHEPRRLWKRYLVYGSQFVILETLEVLGLRRQS
jgi:N-acetylglucosaminyldiphosphoundecaprenol N-acetyl-beta-D-mannosaminyltransferase